MKMLRKKSKHVHVLNCLMVDDDVFEDDLASYCNLSLFCLFDHLTLDRYTLEIVGEEDDDEKGDEYDEYRG